MVDQYKNSYAALKNPRALNWINYLGTVNVRESVFLFGDIDEQFCIADIGFQRSCKGVLSVTHPRNDHNVFP